MPLFSTRRHEAVQPCIEEETANGHSGIFGSVRYTFQSLRHMVNSRLELIMCEFKEEKSRLVSLLVFGLGSVFLGFLMLMSLTAAVTVYFRDNAFAVLAGFAAFYLVAMVGFLMILKKRIKAPMFPETIRQLKKDREELLT